MREEGGRERERERGERACASLLHHAHKMSLCSSNKCPEQLPQAFIFCTDVRRGVAYMCVSVGKTHTHTHTHAHTHTHTHTHTVNPASTDRLGVVRSSRKITTAFWK